MSNFEYLTLLRDIASVRVPYWMKGDPLQYLYLDDTGHEDFWTFRDPAIQTFKDWQILCQVLRAHQRRNCA